MSIFPTLALLALAPLTPQEPRGSVDVPAPSGLAPTSLVAFAADADGDGSVTRDEWGRLVEDVAPSQDEAAAIGADALVAALYEPVWDADGDRRFRRSDVEAQLRLLDTDGDGQLARTDVDRSLGSNGTLLLLVLVRAGDRDGDERLSTQELEELATQADAGRVADWIAIAKNDPPDQTGLFSAGVVLLGIAPALDADRSGHLSRADFAALFETLDADRSGALSVDEWRPRATGNPNRDRWSQATAADKEKPCLIAWQRSLDDALALSRATGKPLLLCVNMDGEPASESLAWVHYRDPAFAALTRGFVPLLASPDRRNLRDWDDRGRRVEDRRFGRLVNSEHIDVEPTLFERYFDGTRVAPRHVGVSPDGEILFDRYLLQSVEPIREDLRRFGNFEVELEPELDPAELWDSPAAAHRAELEALFLAGPVAERERMALVALSDARETQQPELLRLALHDPDPRVRSAGVWTVARHPEKTPVELLGPALFASVGDERSRAALLGGLERLDDPDAQRLVRAHRALEDGSERIDRTAWRAALAWAPIGGSIASGPELYDRLLELEGVVAARPDDVEAALAFGAVALEQAEIDAAAGRDPSILLESARSTAEPWAESEPRAGALCGWASHRLGELDVARAHLERALPGLVPFAGTPLGARALELLADLNTRTLYAALGTDEAWDPAVYADLEAAYAVLLDHPFGTADHAAKRFEVADALGVRGLRAELERSLERFPSESRLHTRLRAQVLRDEGGAALARAYDAITVPASAAAEFAWFRGLAALVAAERAVTNGAGSDALTAYADSIDHFEASVAAEPGYEGSAWHYVALDKAGIADLLCDDGQLEAAGSKAIEALVVSPQSAEYEDGLGRTPLQIARRVQRAAKSAGLLELADRIGAAMPSLVDANG